MTIRKAATVLFLLMISIMPLKAIAPVPRHSPELRFLDAGGREVQLSSFKGKVVVVEFLFLRSEHCMRIAQTLNKLNSELGPRGLQTVGILFGANANGVMAGQVMQALKLTYPMGYTSPVQVDTFLGRQGKETLNIPQIVVIDKAGMIRAQNGGQYDPNLENEGSLRSLLLGLLQKA
ncbi:MAG TPA: TlpA disulfide reductase family protein [Candidatus Angelobacter sp.]|nr:TlpA disulfide reductase family protein [Candidatus Angelobacter sp.]